MTFSVRIVDFVGSNINEGFCLIATVSGQPQIHRDVPIRVKRNSVLPDARFYSSTREEINQWALKFQSAVLLK